MEGHSLEKEIHNNEEAINLLEKIRVRRAVLKSDLYTRYHEKDEFTLFKELKKYESQFMELMDYPAPVEA